VPVVAKKKASDDKKQKKSHCKAEDLGFAVASFLSFRLIA
jgi:hypothetical protein